MVAFIEAQTRNSEDVSHNISGNTLFFILQGGCLFRNGEVESRGRAWHLSHCLKILDFRTPVMSLEHEPQAHSTASHGQKGRAKLKKINRVLWSMQATQVKVASAKAFGGCEKAGRCVMYAPLAQARDCRKSKFESTDHTRPLFSSPFIIMKPKKFDVLQLSY